MAQRYNRANMVQRAEAMTRATGYVFEYEAGSKTYGRKHMFIGEYDGYKFIVSGATRRELIDASYVFTDGFRAAEFKRAIK